MKRRRKKILDSYLAGPSQPRGEAPCHPAADVVQTRAGWLIKLDLACVDPKDVDVTLPGNMVVIRGMRRDHEVSADYQIHSMEISYNRFKRSFRFPTDFADA